MVSLQEAVRLVGSDRVKDRMDGLSMYRRIFNERSSVEKLNLGDSRGHANVGRQGDGEARWMRIMQALFGCVMHERLECTKLGSWQLATQPALRRLQDSAAVVQWMIEQTSSYYSQHIVSSTFNHLTQAIVVQRDLLEPLALPYLKALCTLLSHKAHLDHLDEEAWRRAVGLCFNIALHRPVDSTIWSQEAEVDELEDQDGGHARRGMLKPVQVEAVNVLRVLMSSSYAPLADERGSGVMILSQYSALLNMYSSERSIHLQALIGLNFVVGALQTHNVEALVAFSKHNWKALLALWNTKSRPLKEQVFIALSSMVPYVSYHGDHEMIRQLFFRIVNEVEERHSVKPLNLDDVHLSRSNRRDVFQYDNLRLRYSAPTDAHLAWCILETGADCLSCLNSLPYSVENKDEIPSKRRKLLDDSTSVVEEVGISSILNNATSIRGHSGIWHQQLLLFYILRHWLSTTEKIQQLIITNLTTNASMSDGSLQAWTFIAISEVTKHSNFRSKALSTWQLLCRLTSRGSTGRCASHLARSMLRSDIVPRNELHDGIHSMLADICSYSIALPSDALCGFLVDVLSAARHDIVLSAHKYNDTIFEWLQRGILAITPEPSALGTAASLEAVDLAGLILAVMGRDVHLDASQGGSELTSGTMTKWAHAQARRLEAIAWLLEARLPASKEIGNGQNMTGFYEASAYATLSQTGIRVLKYLENLLDVTGSNSIEHAEDFSHSLQDKTAMCVAICLVQSTLQNEGVNISNSQAMRPAQIINSILQRVMSQERLETDQGNFMHCLRHLKPRARTAAEAGTNAISYFWSEQEAQQLLLTIEKLTWQLIKRLETDEGRFSFIDSRGDFTMSDHWSSDTQKDLLGSIRSKESLQPLEILNFTLLSASGLSQQSHTTFRRVWEIALHDRPQVSCLRGQAMLDGIQPALPCISVDVTNFVFDWLGEALALYASERDVELHLFATKFLHWSSTIWLLPASDSSEDCIQAHEKGLALAQHFIRQLKKGRLHKDVEIELMLLLSKITDSVAHDGDQEALPAFLHVESLSAILLKLAASPSADVWLAAGTKLATIFHRIEASNPVENADKVAVSGSGEIYAKMLDVLPVDTSSISQMACRTFAIGEVLTTSATTCHRAIYHLIESAYATRLIYRHVRMMLHHGAKELGFTNTAHLWYSFAVQLTWAIFSNGYDIRSIPFQALGYDSLDAFVGDNFKPTASVLLATGTAESLRAFQDLTRLARRSVKDALADCSGFVFISHLTSLIAEGKGASLAIQDSGDVLAKRLAEAGGQRDWAQNIDASRPSVIVEVLCRFHQPKMSSFLAEVEKLDKKVAERLTTFQVYDTPFSREPCKPYARGSVVLQSLKALIANMDVGTCLPSVIQCVLITMTVRTCEQKFANDKLRYLQVMQLFIATTWPTIISRPILLVLLIRSLTALSLHDDLLEAAQILLLECLKEIKEPIATLEVCLIRAAEALKPFLSHGSAKQQTFASRTRRLLEENITRLLQIGARLRETLSPTVVAWPFDCPDTWAHQIHSTRAADYAIGILKSRTVHASILQRLYSALTTYTTEERKEFFSYEIWNAVDAIRSRSSKNLNPECCTLLTRIFALSHGLTECSALQMAEQVPSNMQTFTSTESSDQARSRSTQVVRAKIALQLLDFVRYRDPGKSYEAFICLQGILGTCSQFASQAEDGLEISNDARSELDLIGHFGETRRSSRLHHLNELVEPDMLTLGRDFQSWAPRFVSILLSLLAQDAQQPEYICLADFVSQSADDANAFLISALLLISVQGHKKERSKAVAKHVDALFQDVENDKRVWSAMIEAILKVRKERSPSYDLSTHDWMRQIDYLCLAQRAVECDLFASALLLLEIAREHYAVNSAPFTQSAGVLALQYSIYNNIEDPDMFYGIRNSDVRESLIRRLRHERQWDKVLELHAADFEVSGSDIDSIADVFQQRGYVSLSKRVHEFPTQDYEAAWQSQTWSLPAMTDLVQQRSSSYNLYAALRAIHIVPDVHHRKSILERTLQNQVRNVIMMDRECRRAATDAVRHLACVQDVVLWDGGNRLTATKVATSYDGVALASETRLSLLEHTASLRQDGLVSSDALETVRQVRRQETDLLLSLSRSAREESRTDAALKALSRARSKAQKDARDIDVEFANILWAQGEHAIAIEALSRLVAVETSKLPDDPAVLRREGLSLACLGQWQATACALTATHIEDECFKPALEALKRSRDAVAYAEHCYTYAAFAEEQYRVLSSSDEVASLEHFVALREEEIKQLRDLSRNSRGNAKIQRSLDQALKTTAIDRQQLSTFEKSKHQFKLQAGRLYASKLQAADSDRDTEAAVRLVSMLFEHALDSEFVSSLDADVKRVPSRKFIPIVPQISSRLSSKGHSSRSSAGHPPALPFQTLVREVCFVMCRDHPFHSLYSLYALAKGNKGEGAHTRRKANTDPVSSPRDRIESHDARCEGAAELILRIKEVSPKKAQMQQWSLLCDACVEWARFDLPVAMPNIFSKKATNARRRKDQLRIPTHLKIASLRDLDVPIVTKELPIDASCRYTDFVGVARYNERFTTAGGIHLPKITECMGSDGRSYRQLFKDQDDLRQDAVMQQVFKLVNGLLKRDRRATERSLGMRTYMVVPLGPQFGLIEFVVNTVPLLSPISDLYARHEDQFRLTPAQARQELSNAQNKTTKEKAAVYSSVCRRMPPVFRLYFLERCTDPLTFLACRLRYSRSVATTSIVGHTLGIGDRHTSNILVDERTGELVHIDFGVAFDQGRLLPIPELVPFRLTPNIVDAMGMNGVEGLFRRACEETLRVLRHGSSVIKTVLEVFKYDPLYDWTQNPLKVIQGQANQDDASLPTSASSTLVGVGGHAAISGTHMASTRLLHTRGTVASTSSNMNSNGLAEGKEVAELLAERAISSVMSKLSPQLSIEYTVNDLIKRARDPGYLGTIFHGWQAAL